MWLVLREELAWENVDQSEVRQSWVAVSDSVTVRKALNRSAFPPVISHKRAYSKVAIPSSEDVASGASLLAFGYCL